MASNSRSELPVARGHSPLPSPARKRSPSPADSSRNETTKRTKLEKGKQKAFDDQDDDEAEEEYSDDEDEWVHVDDEIPDEEEESGDEAELAAELEVEVMDLNLSDVVEGLDEGAEEEEVYTPEEEISSPVNRFDLPPPELRHGDIRVVLPTNTLVAASITGGGKKVYPPTEGRTIPLFTVEARSHDPVCAQPSTMPASDSLQGVIDQTCHDFDRFIDFSRNARGVPHLLKAVLKAPPSAANPTPPQEVASCLTDDGRRLLALVSNGQPIRASDFDGEEAYRYTGSAVYVKLLYKEQQLVGLYIGLAVISYYRMLVHRLLTLYAKELPKHQQRDKLKPQFIHQIAVANNISTVDVLVAKVRPSSLAYLEFFFITILGAYQHPAWLRIRGHFFSYEPLAHGLNLTPGGDYGYSVDSLGSRWGYAHALYKLRRAVQETGRSDVLEAHDEIVQTQMLNIFRQEGALPSAFRIPADKRARNQDKSAVSRVDNQQCVAQFIDPFGIDFINVPPSAEVTLLGQLAWSWGTPSSSLLTSPEPKEVKRALTSRRHAEPGISPTLQARTTLRHEIIEEKLLSTLPYAFFAELKIIDGPGRTFDMLGEPRFDGMGLVLEIYQGGAEAHVEIVPHSRRRPDIERYSTLANKFFSMLPPSRHEARMTEHLSETARREVAAGLDPIQARWLTGVSFRLYPDPTGTSRLRIRTGLPDPELQVLQVSFDKGVDDALPNGIHQMSKNDPGTLRIGELDANWTPHHDFANTAPYFSYCPLVFRHAHTQEWLPIRITAQRGVSPNHRQHIWRPAMAAMRAFAARQGLVVPASAQEKTTPSAFEARRTLRREHTRRNGKIVGTTYYISLARSDTCNVTLTTILPKLGLSPDDANSVEVEYRVEDGGTASTSTIFVRSRLPDERWVPVYGHGTKKSFTKMMKAWYDGLKAEHASQGSDKAKSEGKKAPRFRKRNRKLAASSSVHVASTSKRGTRSSPIEVTD